MAQRGSKRRKRTKSISYHAKDVFSKVMADLFKGESLSAYGIDIPRIVSAEPTNLPAIEANELRMDNLFHLEDGSYAIIDYESRYGEANKLKYLGYLVRVAKRLYNQDGCIPKLRLIILYTADVTRGSTNPVIDLGCGTIEMTESFLSELDRDKLWFTAEEDVLNGKPLDSKTIIQLIVYPLSYNNLKEKQDAIHRLIELTDQMADDKVKGFILSGMMVFGDKVIHPDDAEEIRRRLMLTKVEKIIAREMQEAVDKAVEQNTEEVTTEVTKSVSSRIALNMLQNGDDIDKVALVTEIPIEMVIQLQATMA